MMNFHRVPGIPRRGDLGAQAGNPRPRDYACRVCAEITPEPTEPERDAIRAALAAGAVEVSAWAEEALREGVEPADAEP